MKIGVLSVFAMLLIFGFAGFVVENDSVNADDSMFVESDSGLFAYQFWNTNPMAIGNTTSVNCSGSMMIQFEVKAYFNDEVGDFRLVVYADNESVFNQSIVNETINETIVFSCENEIVIQSYGQGYFNEENMPVGDFFVAHYSLWEKQTK